MNLIDLLRGNNTVPSANLLFSLINSRHWSGSDELDVCLSAVLDLHITDLDMYDSYSPLYESYIIIYRIWLTNTYWRSRVVFTATSTGSVAAYGTGCRQVSIGQTIKNNRVNPSQSQSLYWRPMSSVMEWYTYMSPHEQQCMAVHMHSSALS